MHEWSDRQAYEQRRVVVAGDAVEWHGGAPAAVMDELPFAVVANTDRDRRNRGETVRVAVARHVVVDVLARKQLAQWLRCLVPGESMGTSSSQLRHQTVSGLPPGHGRADRARWGERWWRAVSHSY